jgi:hypothetical protein
MSTSSLILSSCRVVLYLGIFRRSFQAADGEATAQKLRLWCGQCCHGPKRQSAQSQVPRNARSLWALWASVCYGDWVAAWEIACFHICFHISFGHNCCINICINSCHAAWMIWIVRNAEDLQYCCWNTSFFFTSLCFAALGPSHHCHTEKKLWRGRQHQSPFSTQL